MGDAVGLALGIGGGPQTGVGIGEQATSKAAVTPPAMTWRNRVWPDRLPTAESQKGQVVPLAK
ncbi:MAG: hypothetical protein H7338_22805 [Candidatus Sericytochromatia bacterium]|nr:hypothetical protein [Candidatus Sericytochromatia bacterium]